MKYFGVLTQFCTCLWGCTRLFLISCCNSLLQRPSPHMGRIFSANNLLTALPSLSPITSLGLLFPLRSQERLGQSKTNSHGSGRPTAISITWGWFFLNTGGKNSLPNSWVTNDTGSSFYSNAFHLMPWRKRSKHRQTHLTFWLTTSYRSVSTLKQSIDVVCTDEKY